MYKLMIVEDEEIVREGMLRLIDFESLGYQVVASCENGKIALEEFSRVIPDVVLTDICMAEMDGFTFLSKVYSEQLHTKFIIVTGHDDFSYMKQALRFKVTDYILKPVIPRELKNLLIEVRKKLDAELAALVDLHEMRSEAKRGEFLKRQNFFNKIVGIRLAPAVIAEQAAEMGVTLAGPSFCAVVFDCQDREEAVRNLGLKGDDQLAFMLYNVAEEVAGKHGQRHTFADYYGRTIVLLEGEAERLRQDARTLAAEVVGFFKKSFALKILARTGSAAPGLEHIHASFEQADSLYLVDCADELLDYADWQKRRSGVVFPGAVYAEQLFDALSSEEGAEGLPRVARLHKVAGRMFRREVVESMDLDALRQNVAVVANLLMAKFAAVDVTIPAFSPRGENAEACSRVFLDWLQEVETALGEQTSGKRRAMARIFACIEKNYQDVEFSGETVCREMGMSTSSFSTLFKSVTGTTFTKYLNTYRIERAKEMLRCTDRPVGEVGEKVGYLSNAYFGLVFKNATGLTPNAYRRQYGGER